MKREELIEKAREFCFKSDAQMGPLDHETVHELMADFAINRAGSDQAEISRLKAENEAMRELLDATIYELFSPYRCKDCGSLFSLEWAEHDAHPERANCAVCESPNLEAFKEKSL